MKQKKNSRRGGQGTVKYFREPHRDHGEVRGSMEKRERQLPLLEVGTCESHAKTMPHLLYGKIIYS